MSIEQDKQPPCVECKHYRKAAWHKGYTIDICTHETSLMFVLNKEKFTSADSHRILECYGDLFEQGIPFHGRI